MELKIHNTATGKKEIFKPISPKRIGMYLCGPTVYDHIHIGNGRPLVVFDTLYRLLRYIYGRNSVNYVRNITDVDDKINKRAIDENVSIQELTVANATIFQDDARALRCLEPTHEPRATEHIPQMIEIIKILLEKGHAYFGGESEVHVLFDVSSMPDYGKFAGMTKEELIPTERSSYYQRLTNTEFHGQIKRSPEDFVLWKPSPPELPGWDNPWNERGRPGWHIECSAMSREYLGETFDLHMGGQDLIFPHHQNEIAQSCCAFPNESFARYWMHNGYVLSEGKKMSKSLGNFYTVQELAHTYTEAEPSYFGSQLRILLLQSHYRQPLDFYKSRMDEVDSVLEKFYKLMEEYKGLATENDTYHENNAMPIFEALCDDLNTPLALHRWHESMTALRRYERYEDYLAVRTGANIFGIPQVRAVEPSVEDLLKEMQAISIFHSNKEIMSDEEKEIKKEEEKFKSKENEIIRARKYIKARKQKDFDQLDKSFEDLNRDGNEWLDSKSISEVEEIIDNEVKKLYGSKKHAEPETTEMETENEATKEIKALIQERKIAKGAKDFDKADRIRDNLKLQGIELEDHADGTTWKIKGH